MRSCSLAKSLIRYSYFSGRNWNTLRQLDPISGPYRVGSLEFHSVTPQSSKIMYPLSNFLVVLRIVGQLPPSEQSRYVWVSLGNIADILMFPLEIMSFMDWETAGCSIMGLSYR